MCRVYEAVPVSGTGARVQSSRACHPQTLHLSRLVCDHLWVISVGVGLGYRYRFVLYESSTRPLMTRSRLSTAGIQGGHEGCCIYERPPAV